MFILKNTPENRFCIAVKIKYRLSIYVVHNRRYTTIPEHSHYAGGVTKPAPSIAHLTEKTADSLSGFVI